MAFLPQKIFELFSSTQVCRKDTDRVSWFEKALQGFGVMLLPITPQIAGMAVDLPEHHSDPQDRIIIATALAHEWQLMSADRKFPLYEELASCLL